MKSKKLGMTDPTTQSPCLRTHQREAYSKWQTSYGKRNPIITTLQLIKRAFKAIEQRHIIIPENELHKCDAC